jgi:uncharacterized protein YbjT (DUF2867 family)
VAAAALAATKSRSVLVLGATGLVGSECLRQLIGDETCTSVVALTRRSHDRFVSSPKLEVHTVNFDKLWDHEDLFEVDQVVCALGTTARKTPSRDLYRKIDYEYPLTAARLAKEHGASHYLVVTAIGANARSPVFYNRLKGEVEDGLALLDYRSLTIARPSVLIGERAESRLSERIAWKLAFMTPRKYKPVPASRVATALVTAARKDLPGLRIIDNAEML